MSYGPRCRGINNIKFFIFIKTVPKTFVIVYFLINSLITVFVVYKIRSREDHNLIPCFAIIFTIKREIIFETSKIEPCPVLNGLH